MNRMRSTATQIILSENHATLKTFQIHNKMLNELFWQQMLEQHTQLPNNGKHES